MFSLLNYISMNIRKQFKINENLKISLKIN